MTGRATWWRALGPGVLFTGAAVGVSHLVQSTRAGAGYGLALLPFVLLALLMKYPAFRLGPHYSAATGHSLLEGYRKQGRWALVVYGLLTLGTMFTVQAAVTLVTAGLFSHLLGLRPAPVLYSALLLGLCAALLAVGRYRWLDRISKAVVVVLAVSTLLATALALPRLGPETLHFWPDFAHFQKTDAFFVVALVGWMPSAIDVSVWQSLWTLARARDSGHRPSVQESALDFHVGYVGTGILAFCFVILGAAVMHGQQPAASAGAFAAQFVDLYVETLGPAARPLIALSSFFVMFSTTLTVVDGFPRALSMLAARLRGPEGDGLAEQDLPPQRRTYWLGLVVLGVGSLLVLALLLTSLRAMVDLATTLSFLTAPLLSVLNHRAVFAVDLPAQDAPSESLRRASLLAILAQGAFALYYLALRFVF